MTIELPDDADAIIRAKAAAAGYGDDVGAYVASLVLADEKQAVQEDQRSAYEVAKQLGLIGCIKDGPTDLSTNPDHMTGFGRDQENRSR